MAFQVGPYSIGIAVVDARRLLAAEMIVEVYQQDMTAKRATVKDIHKLQGFERKSPVAIEVDKQYKNPLKNSQKNSLHTSHTDQRHSL